MAPGLVPLVAFAPVLVFAAVSDLRRLRIPNWCALAAIAIFAVSLPSLPDWPLRLAAGAVVLVIGMALWARGFFGGGDVKILAGLALLIPSAHWSIFLFTLAACLAIGMAAILALRSRRPDAPTGWAVIDAEDDVPMGFPIALAGTAFPAVLTLL